MAESILTDRSFILNNLLSGSFLFNTREDAFALTSTNLESNIAQLFSIMANVCARLDGWLFKQQACQRECLETCRLLGITKEGTQ